MAARSSSDDRTIRIPIGPDELVIRRKYEVASILNDVMVAGWFIAGSILFFSESTTTAGTWLFLLGSVQLLIRPLIRLARHVHLRRFAGDAPRDAGGGF
ncbi:YrhK family protein [Microbacterium sp. 179-B 1A2 NHS]|uniref:YrhK family protein n=1 Tax=Microbacterium sp. 179-B 1A2 NHS TaxID=3142383 RepID=UPI0039A32F5A